MVALLKIAPLISSRKTFTLSLTLLFLLLGSACATSSEEPPLDESQLSAEANPTEEAAEPETGEESEELAQEGGEEEALDTQPEPSAEDSAGAEPAPAAEEAAPAPEQQALVEPTAISDNPPTLAPSIGSSWEPTLREVHYVKINEATVHSAADPQAAVVARLEQGFPVVVLKQNAAWAELAPGMYVATSSLASKALPRLKREQPWRSGSAPAQGTAAPTTNAAAVPNTL